MRALSSDVFARKHELNVETDVLWDQLRNLLLPNLDAANTEWADRAARKASHAVDFDEKAVMARTPTLVTANP